MGRKFFWVQKNLPPKWIMPEIFLGQKNLGRKFGLAKLYFGLIRFVCVMLLVTAKLNNNNTESYGRERGWLSWSPVLHTNMNLNISKHIRNSKKVIDLMRSMIRLNWTMFLMLLLYMKMYRSKHTRNGKKVVELMWSMTWLSMNKEE